MGRFNIWKGRSLTTFWYNKMLETREAMAIQLNEMADIIEYYTKPVSQEKRKSVWYGKLFEKEVKGRKNYCKKSFYFGEQ